MVLIGQVPKYQTIHPNAEAPNDHNLTVEIEPTRLIFQPIQIIVFVFVFQIHQCLTQIFEKQPSAHL